MIAAFVTHIALAADEEPPAEVSPALAAAAADPHVATLEAWLGEQGTPPDRVHDIALGMMAMEQGVAWQRGDVTLRDGAIVLHLGEGDRYAPPADTARILEGWGNPPGQENDGLLLPAGSHLFGPGTWAVLVNFAEEGWVDDSEAAEIDYDELLTGMQESQEQGNEQRRNLGLDPVHITGWAESPHYDGATNVLYWATLLRSDGGSVTLNYDVRVLGRRGVLSLNALADEKDLPTVKAGMEHVRALASFTEGHRYADYVPGTDKKAAYGLAALVAGGAIAAKTGLLKGLFVALLASKKLLVVGALALFGGLRAAWSRLFSREDRQG